MSTRGLLGVVLLGLVFGGGCFRGTLAGRYPLESISVPNSVEYYETTLQPEGAVGGKGVEELRAEIEKALAERGERAEADGALGATASFALRELNEGRQLDLITLEAASRRFGFAGVLISTSGFDMSDRDTWREQLENTAKNIPITRYGIRVSPGGRSAAVVYGATEVEYQSIPRTFQPGQSVTLKGRVGSRFQSCHVYLTKPDGKVLEKSIADRSFDTTFVLSDAGKYRLEVMGDGPTGPVVVSNVPLYVGIPEPAVEALRGTVVDPETAEARMLVLLNEARKTAGLNPVRHDDELREIALSHSSDMVENDFFGHVSPTTGTPADRVRAAGTLVSIAGENVAIAPTPEAAHQGLMDSPGHRANMLRAEFTHVGIGAKKASGGIAATMVLGRRPAESAVPANAAQIESAVSALRAEKNLPAVKIDAIYRASAQAGADVYADGGDQKEIGKAIQSTLIREVQRARSSRPGGCTLALEVLEPIQLRELSPLVQAGLKRYGIGARLRKDAKGTRLSTVFLLEGVSCE